MRKEYEIGDSAYLIEPEKGSGKYALTLVHIVRYNRGVSIRFALRMVPALVKQ